LPPDAGDPSHPSPFTLAAVTAAVLAALSIAGCAAESRTDQWPSPSGRMNFQGQVSGVGTAIDLWPPFTMPTQHSLSELTLYRTGWWEFETAGIERLSLSAMANDHYRISIERDDNSQWRPLIVCFDHAVPGSAHACPFKIEPGGVFVNVAGEWRAVAYR
jgi:hypothetical protein